jgi:uncharacterized SAM-dependent methyltransferase
MKAPASFATVRIHASQFPENVRRDLLSSLRTRRVNHKFHYDSVKQTQKWLALHQVYSPTRNDADCVAMYEKSFAAAAAYLKPGKQAGSQSGCDASSPHGGGDALVARGGVNSQIKSESVHVIGLGCGGGQKDTRLLKLLSAAGKQISYTPCDVASAMVLVARQTALTVVPDENCFPFVCDLAAADDLSESLATRHPSLVTFFGMIPNFAPDVILPKLASLIRPQDWLLFSANLAPGTDYAAGVEKILPQYDNAPTREWLLTFLLDLGVERADGELRFQIETDATSGLRRVAAHFHFTRPRRIEIEAEAFEFASGDAIQLFFSYRYPPARVSALLAHHGLEVCDSWLAASEEEGVFLCRRK